MKLKEKRELGKENRNERENVRLKKASEEKMERMMMEMARDVAKVDGIGHQP